MKKKKKNRGSVEFQVFCFTNKIRKLTSHLKLHKQDYASRRGLRKNSRKTSTTPGLFIK
ncbi:hypothetical protein RND81_O191700 [Saponaria officinalis]|uniref:Small ribosomal subunit protein uS15c n=1 Tax=Saponaria officinalis TaxID=3572 RepID=A0AAW1GBE4_SAPOF